MSIECLSVSDPADTWFGPSEAPQKIADVLQPLCKLGYNWNGNRELPARDDVIQFVTHRLMRRNGGMSNIGMPCPVAQLGRDGAIHFTFGRPKDARRLLLRIPCNGIVEYTKTATSDGTQIKGSVRVGWNDLTPEELTDLFNWLSYEQ